MYTYFKKPLTEDLANFLQEGLRTYLVSPIASAKQMVMEKYVYTASVEEFSHHVENFGRLASNVGPAMPAYVDGLVLRNFMKCEPFLTFLPHSTNLLSTFRNAIQVKN